MPLAALGHQLLTARERGDWSGLAIGRKGDGFIARKLGFTPGLVSECLR